MKDFGAQLLSIIVGGLLGFGASLGTIFVQQLLRERGKVACYSGEEWTVTEKSSRGVTGTQPTVFDYKTALKFHNKKGVSVGLLDLHIEVFGDEGKVFDDVRPNAKIQYMTVQDPQTQAPFEAATLPAQEIVVLWLEGTISDTEQVAKFPQRTKVELHARLSTGQRFERTITDKRPQKRS